MTAIGLTRRNVTRHIRPESIPAFTPSYGDVTVYDGAGNVLRVIPKEWLMRRASPVPDPDGRVPSLAKAKRRRGPGLPVVIHPREIYPDYDVPRVRLKRHVKERV